ncbi:MAG: type ISP restriction/modification enzyme [Chloroflexota bacterium]
MDTVFFPQNNARVRGQRSADIRVVIANPPYSVGQTSENDANKNLAYPTLDQRIRETYAARSNAGLKRNLYDSYVRAFRWATDRIKDRGIVCFVTNGAYIDTGSFDGFRKSLMDEFTSVYCFNLRGNARTSGEQRQKERGNVFGEGSRTPIAVTILVKNPDRTANGVVHYHDIGDYLSRAEKLRRIQAAGSLEGVPWEQVSPDQAGDWINQRSDEFDTFLPLGTRQSDHGEPMFEVRSLGVTTNRDAWVYSYSASELRRHVNHLQDFYNDLLTEFKEWSTSRHDSASIAQRVEDFVSPPARRDPQRIAWSPDLKANLGRERPLELATIPPVHSLYRPYCKMWTLFDRSINERVGQIPRFFPTTSHENLVICTSGVGARRPFSAVITDCVPSRDLQDTGQCFPRYIYDQPAEGRLAGFNGDLVEGYERRDGITDATLTSFRARYGTGLTKEDIFYYVYAVLHSLAYREKFSADLKKMLPRMPLADDVLGFRDAGRALAQWHLNYETVEPQPLDGMPDGSANPGQLKVVEMKYPKSAGIEDRSSIVFNSHITLSGIPEEAYRYRIEGKAALEWIMERYKVTTDTASGIRNDPNQWSDDPYYVVDLVARIVRVSLETVRIVEAMPALRL